MALTQFRLKGTDRRSITAVNRWYYVEGPKGNIEVEAANVSGALAKYQGRSPGKAWSYQRQANGWVICSNEGKKSLESRALKIKEANWNRNDYFPI